MRDTQGCVTRSNIVRIYKNKDLDVVSKFLVAMIWGHSSGIGGKADNRGPYRMNKCFGASNAGAAVQAINSVNIDSDENIIESYKTLKASLKGCGPAFFTKHLYFLGKSRNQKRYPRIFDARVANGLLQVSGVKPDLIDMLSVAPVTTPEAYLSYLSICREAATYFGCSLDQVELFLFRGPNAINQM